MSPIGGMMFIFTMACVSWSNVAVLPPMSDAARTFSALVASSSSWPKMFGLPIHSDSVESTEVASYFMFNNEKPSMSRLSKRASMAAEKRLRRVDLSSFAELV